MVNMQNKIKYIIFDMFDTLVYIDKKRNSYYDLFKELNLTRDEARNAKNIALTNNFENLEEFVKVILPRNHNVINLQKYERAIQEEIKNTKLYKETLETLHELKTDGYRLGLISNLASPYKQSFFDLGLSLYFDETIFSCDYQMKKPEAEIYLESLECLEFKQQETLMIGNHQIYDVKVPISLGFNAIHLNRNNILSECKSISTLDQIFRHLI